MSVNYRLVVIYFNLFFLEIVISRFPEGYVRASLIWCFIAWRDLNVIQMHPSSYSYLPTKYKLTSAPLKEIEFSLEVNNGTQGPRAPNKPTWLRPN